MVSDMTIRPLVYPRFHVEVDPDGDLVLWRTNSAWEHPEVVQRQSACTPGAWAALLTERGITR